MRRKIMERAHAYANALAHAYALLSLSLFSRKGEGGRR